MTGAVWWQSRTRDWTGNYSHILVDTNDVTASSTVAELAAIQWALEHTNRTHVATDSLTSMHLVHGYLRSPTRYWLHPLLHVLQNVAEALLDRHHRGVHTTFLKVKAHSGVMGNEMADWHCRLALQHTDSCNHVVVSLPQRTHWLHISSDREGAPPVLVSSLRDVKLSSHIQQHTATAAVRTDGIYYSSYQTLAPSVHPSSHKFLTCGSLPFGATRLGILYRGGHIFNNKLAYRYRLVDSPRCPLCGQPDSQAHILGGCRHPHMHALYCLRHNQAARTALAFLIDNVPNMAPIQAHIGNSESLPVLSCLPDVVPGCTTDLVRPDFTMSHVDPTTGGHPNIHIFEIKFGPDTRLRDTCDAARQTYAPLLCRLKTSTRRPPSLHLIVLGVGGTITMDVCNTLYSLGLTDRAVHTLLNNLNDLAIRWLHHIVVTRTTTGAHYGPHCLMTRGLP
jgi:RNase H.